MEVTVEVAAVECQTDKIQNASVQTYGHISSLASNDPPKPKSFVGTKTVAVQSENPPVKAMAPPPPPLPETPPLTEARPHSRANAKDLARLENEVREKIGRIYEKITGFVQQGVVDPKSIRVQYPNYEHLDVHQNRADQNRADQLPNPMSRNITPEAGEFDFHSMQTPDASLQHQMVPNSRTISYYSVKDVIPETILEEDENKKSLDTIQLEGVVKPSVLDQVQMIEEANALHLQILDQQQSKQTDIHPAHTNDLSQQQQIETDGTNDKINIPSNQLATDTQPPIKPKQPSSIGSKSSDHDSATIDTSSLSETLSSSSMVTCTESETTFSKSTFSKSNMSKSVGKSKKSDTSHKKFVRSLFD